MLRQSEIRSASVSNEARIAIANRTGNVADFRHCRRRIRIRHSGLFRQCFLAVKPALLSRPCGRARISCGRGKRSRESHNTKHARSRLSQPTPIILFVSVTPGTHWKMQRPRAAGLRLTHLSRGNLVEANRNSRHKLHKVRVLQPRSSRPSHHVPQVR